MTDHTTPAGTRDELIEQAAQLLANMHVDLCSSGKYEAIALADAGLLADPELQADLKRARDQRDGVMVELGAMRDERDQLKARLDAAKLTWAAAAAIADVGAAENPARWETAQAAIVDFGKALNGDQPAEPAWTQASPQAAPSVQASGEATGGDL